MSLMREMRTAIVATIGWFMITVILYPAIILVVSLAVPQTAQGSLVDAQGRGTTNPAVAVGSLLIGQPFTSERYFWGRPSSTNYSTADPTKDEAGILKTGVSGATNLAPSNPALLDRIKGDLLRLQASGLTAIPADLVYTSGSSLDPHISPTAAQLQVSRVAAARQASVESLQRLIEAATDGRFLGIFGDPGVNVLKLNLALDQQFPS